MKYCSNCGWLMEYQPRSYQEHIQEIIGNQIQKGHWRCSNCNSEINGEKVADKSNKKSSLE